MGNTRAIVGAILNLIKLAGPTLAVAMVATALYGGINKQSFWDWKWGILVFMIAYFSLFLVGIFLSYQYKSLIQQERNEFATKIYDNLENNSYSIYLRPFSNFGEISISGRQKQRGYFGPFYPAFYTGQDHINFEDFMAIVMEEDAPLVAINPSVEDDESTQYYFQQYRAGKIESQDDDWFDKFKILSQHAKYILVYPGAPSNGLLNEIGYILQNNLLDKCVFIMPPLDRIHDYKLIDKPTLQQKWLNSKKVLQETYGLRLPPSRDSGAIFKLDKTGNVYVIEPFPLDYVFMSFKYPQLNFNPKKVREAINQLK